MIQKENMIGQETVTDRNGTQMKRADMAVFEAALHRQFPDGLVIPLPDYRLADLMDQIGRASCRERVSLCV